MQRLKQRADEAYGRLSADIARIKQQKVCVARLGAVAQGEGGLGGGFQGWGGRGSRENAQWQTLRLESPPEQECDAPAGYHALPGYLASTDRSPKAPLSVVSVSQ